MLEHLQRQQLVHPNDARLHTLFESIATFTGVSEIVRSPDFTVSADPILPFRLERGELKLSFVTTVTAFSAPQNVTIEELRIESYYPADAATDAACRAMAQ